MMIAHRQGVGGSDEGLTFDIMKDEGVEDSVRWTLDQLKTRSPCMIRQAGYDEIAQRIDQQALPSISPDWSRKYWPNTNLQFKRSSRKF